MNFLTSFFLPIRIRKIQNDPALYLSEIKKILVVRLSSLGDVTLTFPLLKKLKEKFPSSEMHFLVNEKYSEILKLNPLTDKILFLNENLSLSRKEIKNEKYDLIFDLQKNARSTYATFGNARIIKRIRKENAKKFLLTVFKFNLLKNVIPVYRKYLNAASDYLSENDYGFTLSELKFSRDKIIDGKYIVIAPASRHFTKTYPKEKFVKYIQSLKNIKTVLVGDDTDNDMQICAYIEKSCDGIVNMCGKLNIKSLLNVICNSEYTVSNDSAVMHLAEAVGKKTIAVFGCTVKEFGFFPQLKESVVIENKELECRPCTHIGRSKCPKKNFKCMDLIIN